MQPRENRASLCAKKGGFLSALYPQLCSLSLLTLLNMIPNGLMGKQRRQRRPLSETLPEYTHKFSIQMVVLGRLYVRGQAVLLNCRFSLRRQYAGSLSFKTALDSIWSTGSFQHPGLVFCRRFCEVCHVVTTFHEIYKLVVCFRVIFFAFQLGDPMLKGIACVQLTVISGALHKSSRKLTIRAKLLVGRRLCSPG